MVESLRGRVERLESELNRAPVRTAASDGGLQILTVLELPAIPNGKRIVWLQSIDAAQLPAIVAKPDAKDTFWTTGKEDVRWHPVGGKFVDIAGDPGDRSEA